MIEKPALYPLKFEPILKEKIWGGDKLHTFLEKKIDSNTTGESWEISDVDGSSSVVASGTYKGKTLQELIQQFRDKLVGTKVYENFGTRFPLLIKFIDAQKDLSVQLHPDDELAKERHNSFGKTEMWYVIQADKDAELILDFKEKISPKVYTENLQAQTLTQILNFEPAKKGDAFFIKPGLVHAIGEGILLAEIQQTSDITYRVYDWNRKDAAGKTRELHTELAMDAIDFNRDNEFRVDYTSKENAGVSLVKNKYFNTNLICVSDQLKIDYSTLDSFVIYMCVEGKVKITVAEHFSELKKGETILMPACFDEAVLSGKGELLEVSI